MMALFYSDRRRIIDTKRVIRAMTLFVSQYF
jgi:hypothetical protein